MNPRLNVEFWGLQSLLAWTQRRNLFSMAGQCIPQIHISLRSSIRFVFAIKKASKFWIKGGWTSGSFWRQLCWLCTVNPEEHHEVFLTSARHNLSWELCKSHHRNQPLETWQTLLWLFDTALIMFCHYTWKQNVVNRTPGLCCFNI